MLPVIQGANTRAPEHQDVLASSVLWLLVHSCFYSCLCTACLSLQAVLYAQLAHEQQWLESRRGSLCPSVLIHPWLRCMHVGMLCSSGVLPPTRRVGCTACAGTTAGCAKAFLRRVGPHQHVLNRGIASAAWLARSSRVNTSSITLRPLLLTGLASTNMLPWALRSPFCMHV